MKIFLYNSTNGSEPPAADLKDYAGIYLQANDLNFAKLRDKYFNLGVYWGAWWKFDKTNPAGSAYSLSGLLKGNSGDLPPAIQVFTANESNYSNYIGQLQIFFIEFIRWFGKVPVFETNTTTWDALSKFTIPSLIGDAPLWLWGTRNMPQALTSHDDTTIEFQGTKAELFTWSQTYQQPVAPPIQPPVNDAKLLEALETLKQYFRA